MKPHGFWYEVNGDWRRWARGEDFQIGAYIHCVDLADCNVLKIDTLTALDAFHAAYGEDSGRMQPEFTDIRINWQRLAEAYDGVEIAPYQWERRLHIDFGWYYGWDCASGVIWRPRGVTAEKLALALWQSLPWWGKVSHFIRHPVVAVRFIRASHKAGSGEDAG